MSPNEFGVKIIGLKQAGAGAVPSSVQLSAMLSTTFISSVWN